MISALLYVCFFEVLENVDIVKLDGLIFNRFRYIVNASGYKMFWVTTKLLTAGFGVNPIFSCIAPTKPISHSHGGLGWVGMER